MEVQIKQLEALSCMSHSGPSAGIRSAFEQPERWADEQAVMPLEPVQA